MHPAQTIQSAQTTISTFEVTKSKDGE